METIFSRSAPSMKSLTSTCSRCGKELPTDAPRELCPPCLLEAVLSAPDDFMGEERDDETLHVPEAPDVPDFRLQQLLGAGGFGEVYSAEQIRPIRRAVALKVLKRGMNTRQVMKRFEAERQALALMEHPNIATVYDAGETADKRPYVAMELVKGPPVTTFCDREEWKIPARLELFITICEAVQHAHQKGVIHRDLKPSNLLVARDESGEATPTVIDFGIAKALDEPLTNHTVVTQIHQVMGTPAYMSPEQTDHRGAFVDTRSDIYALGVILYELLTGTVPFPASKDDSVLETWMKRIREEEPERPSLRMERVTHGPRRAWIKETRGDLDWIVLKALEKDPERRYESARALADDLRRHLNYEPVLASPPSNLYRVGKLVRRHRVAASFAAALTVAVLAGFGGTMAMYFRAEGARQAEADARAELSASYSRSDLIAADQMSGRGQSAQAVAVLTRALRTDPGNQIARSLLLHVLSHGSFFRDIPQQLPVDPKIERIQFIEVSEDGNEVIWAGSGSSASFVQHGDRCWQPRPDAKLVGLSLAPDGGWFVGAWDDGRIEVRSLTRDETATNFPTISAWESGAGSVEWLKVLPDGNRVAARTSEQIRIWTLSSTEEPLVIDPAGTMLSIAVSGDGQVIAAGTGEGEVRAWSTTTGEQVGEIDWRGESVSQLDLSYDGQLAALGSPERRAQVFRLVEGRPVGPPRHHPSAVTNVRISPDETMLVTGCEDGCRRVWSLIRNRLIMQESPLDQPVSFIGVDPSGHTLTVGRNGQVRVGQLTNLRTSALGSRRLIEVAMNTRGTRFFGWSPSTAEINGWNIRSGGVGSILLDSSMDLAVNALMLDPEGQQLLVAESRTALQRIDLSTAKPIGSPLAIDGNPIAMNQDFTVMRSGYCHFLTGAESWQFSPHVIRHAAINAQYVVGSAAGHILRIGDLSERKSWPIKLDGEEEIRALAWSPTEPLLAVGFDPGAEIRIIDPRSGKTRARLKSAIPIRSLVFSPDGRHLFSGSATGSLRLWDIKTEETVWGRPMPAAASAVAASGDGKRLVAGTTRGLVRVFDLETGLPLSIPVNLGESISSIATDHHGEVVAVGFETGAVRWLRFPMAGPVDVPLADEFLSFAEQISGWHMDRSGTLDRLAPSNVVHELPPELAVWRDWILADPGSRPCFPGLTDSTSDYIRSLLDSENERTRREGRRLRAWLEEG